MDIRIDLLTIRELAEQLEVTCRTLERWNAQRIGPPRIKLGKKVYYRIEAVKEWILSQEQAQPRAVKAIN